MSDSMRPHWRQPTRLPHPRVSLGKKTGVGCHFLLQCMKVKSESEVAQSCPTLSYPMDCSPPGSSIHGVFQAKEYWNGVPLPSPICVLNDVIDCRWINSSFSHNCGKEMKKILRKWNAPHCHFSPVNHKALPRDPPSFPFFHHTFLPTFLSL